MRRERVGEREEGEEARKSRARRQEMMRAEGKRTGDA